MSAARSAISSSPANAQIIANKITGKTKTNLIGATRKLNRRRILITPI